MRPRPDLFQGVLPFVRTAEERSFGRAAASLGISTPAVSKAIKKLESELDVRLLDRSSRAVRLTREGEIFLARCRTAVADVQSARDAVQRSDREPAGELVVTIPIPLGGFLVPRLARFAAAYPRLEIRLHVSDRIARVADEGIDVAIRMGDLPSSALVSRLLRRTRWVTCASPAYLARTSTPTTVEGLTAHNCLRFLAPNGKPRDWTFAHDGEPRAVAVAGTLTIDHGPHLITAAEAGIGICQVLDFMVEGALRAGSLVEVLGSAAADGPNLTVLTTPARSRSSNVRAFTRMLLDAFKL